MWRFFKKLHKGKDKRKQDEFLDSLYRILYRSIYPIILDHEKTIDLVQDSWEKIVRESGTLRDPDKLVPWVKKIAFYTSINWLKKNRLKEINELLTEDFSHFEGIHLTYKLEYSIEGEILYRELKYALLKAIESLPNHYKVVVILKYYYSLKDEEIGNAMGIPTGTVKSRLNKSKKLLYETLHHSNHESGGKIIEK